MATEITARLYVDSEPAPATLFRQLIEAVEQWGEELSPWQGLRVSRPRRQVIHQQDSPLDTASILAAAEPFSDPSHQIASRVSYRCWRFHGTNAELGSTLAWVEAWGDEYGRAAGEDVRRVWGSAAFTIADGGPYYAVIDRTDAAAATVNERVEDNLERLTRLVFRLTEVIKPASLKIFTDQGAYLPFNAHLAYYASEARVLEDLRLIADVWRTGLPAHQLPPLGEIRDGRSIAFHWWRSDEARKKLVADLDRHISGVDAITVDDVRRTIATGEFDNYRSPDGFILLDFPHFMNAFLDRFFRRLLESRMP